MRIWCWYWPWFYWPQCKNTVQATSTTTSIKREISYIGLFLYYYAHTHLFTRTHTRTYRTFITALYRSCALSCAKYVNAAATNAVLSNWTCTVFMTLSPAPTCSILNKLKLRGGPDDTWGGGLCFFFPCANFFSFAPNQKQTFFPSGKRTRSFFPPHIPHFSASFVDKLFIFYSLLNKLFVITFCWTVFCFSKKINPIAPPTHTHLSSGRRASGSSARRDMIVQSIGREWAIWRLPRMRRCPNNAWYDLGNGAAWSYAGLVTIVILVTVSVDLSLFFWWPFVDFIRLRAVMYSNPGNERYSYKAMEHRQKSTRQHEIVPVQTICRRRAFDRL